MILRSLQRFADKKTAAQSEHYRQWVDTLKKELKAQGAVIAKLKADLAAMAAMIKDMKAEKDADVSEIEQLTTENKSLHNQVAIQEDVIVDLRKWQELQLALKEKEIAIQERARLKAQLALSPEPDDEVVS